MAVAETAVKFTENKNQWPKQALYAAQLDGGMLFLQKNCFTYNFYDKETLRKNHVRSKDDDLPPPSSSIASHAFRMNFINALQNVTTSATQITHDYANYFIGKDKTKWASNAHNYREVNYKNLYRGINLQVLGLQNSIKYNFIVSPYANANDILLSYEGLDKITLDNGVLNLKTSVNGMQEQRPFAYQWIENKRVTVPCEFVLENNKVHFSFPEGYNKTVELVIDPILVFACSSGSTADNFGMTATYDAQGDLYSGGTCFNVGFPTTVGAFDVTYNGIVAAGLTDVVITKYDSSGTFLQYSTYLGGATGTEIVTSLIVDASNNLYAYGATGSTDFPVTAGAYDMTFNGGTYMSFAANGTKFSGGTDIYVAKLNPTGSTLLACTYIGGSGNDGVNNNNDTVYIPSWGVYEYPLDSLQYNYGDQYRGEINVDPTGNVYIASSTRSPNFPIVNGFDNTLGGKQDAVVFKMSGDLTTLIWSTYLGGSDNDAGYALALDDTLNVYVTGGTRSNNFPTIAGALHTSYNGGKADGYITKINRNGTYIMNSTYIGTNVYDQTYFVQLDKNDNVYVVGQTEGSMPVTAGVYNNANGKQFISKLDKTLSTLIFSTVFGNGTSTLPNISPAAFLIDDCENIYVTGWGGNIITGVSTSGMPITPGAYLSTTDGFNFYLFVLTANASSLFYATYFGGALSREHVDGGTSRFDKKGIVYQSVCAGCGGHDDFPVTPGSWPYTSTGYSTSTGINFSSNCNNGTFKFNFQVPPVQAQFSVNNVSGCSPYTVTFNNTSTSWQTYLWNFGDGTTSSTILNPTITYTTPGTYTVTLVASNGTCNASDTAITNITVYPPFVSDFNFTTTPCSDNVVFTDSSHTAPTSWFWNFDDGGATSTLQNPSHVYPSGGTYNVQLVSQNAVGCVDTTVIQLDLTTPIVSVNPSTSICTGLTTQLNATGGYAYSWSPAAGLSSATVANPYASPAATTTYTVTIHSVTAAGDTCVATITTTVSVYTPASFPLTATATKDTIILGSSTTLHANTDTTLSVIWTPATGLNSATSFNPTASPTVTTSYVVTITDSSGCPKKDTVTIYVISLRCNLDDAFVPNTFTPNGDGKNDILYVRSISVKELYFAVYDRWGEMVFETTDINKGWDGIYKGKLANPDVYGWYLKVKCYNGDEMDKKGDVSLIR